VRELLEEHRPDRARADEAHVAAQHVDELRNLVKLRGLEPLADRRELGLGPADELLAEVRAEPAFGVAAQRPELQHREDASTAPDSLAAVEDGRAARQEHDERDDEGDREGAEQKDRGQRQIERAQENVAPPSRRLEGQLPVAANERVLDDGDARTSAAYVQA
jgi:hypothetical protein